MEAARRDTAKLTAVLAAYSRRRFAWLFVSLLLTVGARPVIAAMSSSYNPLEFLLALNLAAAIASVSRKRELLLLLSLGIAFAVTRSLQAALGTPAILPLSEGLWVMAGVLAMVAAVRHALAPGAVDSERIFAALDAYLLTGLLFGVGYWMLAQTWPGSFGGEGSAGLDLESAVYFSFVTLATLGYGDIVPVSEPARGLATVEGVSGQLYLTVLVARLVSLYARQRDG